MISVIIPNYNHALFLNQRIDSILEQTYQDFELIILDDCSTDDSKAIIETYRTHPNVSHIVYNEENSGTPFFQWQKGVALAQGEFIWIAESDDFAEPDFLKSTLAKIETDKQIGLVYTDSNIIQNGIKENTFKKGNSTYMNDVDWEIDHLVNGPDELERHLIRNCMIYNASAVLFRKEALKSVIHEITGFRYAGDWVCYMLIALNYNIYYIAETLSNYRSHDQNLSKKSWKSYISILERIKARHFIGTKLDASQSYLSKKIRNTNLLDFRVLFGGVIRGRISPITFYKTLKHYI